MQAFVIYHGSESVIGTPVYGAGNPHNDYGIGFYCTEERNMAAEWACKTPAGGYVNRYELDAEGFDILRLTDPSFHILNWLAVLLENRIFPLANPLPREARQYILETFLPDYKNRDVIIGYRADDSYFSFARAFLNNTISLSQLSSAMRLGRLGEQVVIKSRKAFSRIAYSGSEFVPGTIWYPRRIARDTAARDAFRDLSAGGKASDAVYMLDILREKWRNDDERLF